MVRFLYPKVIPLTGVLGTVLINEIAPRPHNSGHYTIEACETSQYENHLRAILSLPLGSTALKVPSACMLNLIGVSASISDFAKVTEATLKTSGASLHMYGKAECRKGRKMGHITIVAESDAEIHRRLRPLLLALPITNAEEDANKYAPEAPQPGSGFANHHPRHHQCNH